ncbi:isatin hydrolase-like [Portunus trituberculatus]|uniref:Kynurenine formamidase n=1 Tax=Portunus trituberculatus TaxID=210409 RepID=A0A5B7F6D6_PORTR|nr:isatin hydrolase-like [Portunus trituberculatus]MPC43140.1 Kynurenine formamidase [Portunus trituberculatus]
MARTSSLCPAIAFLLLVLVATSPAASRATKASPPRLLDLTYTYNVDAPTMPSLRAFNMTTIVKGVQDEGYWLEMNEFCSAEHSGTHVDAPVHFSRTSWPVNAIPLDRLWRLPGVVIDVQDQVSTSKDKNYAIPVSDLEAWESRHGAIPDGAVVFLRTGWGAKSRDLDEYSGVDQHGTLNFPGLSKEAGTWLATYGARKGLSKGVVGVGIDTSSVDVGSSTNYEAHSIMYSHNVYGIENVANMDQLPITNFLVTVMPMKIGGGSGGPSRVIAELLDESPSSASRDL